MAYTKRTSGRYAPDWDRGNGWMVSKEEWQDWDNAVVKDVTPEELKEFRCPASGSEIRVLCDHIQEGLSFTLDVQAKEYQENKRHFGNKYNYRKPTHLRRSCEGVFTSHIPMPGSFEEGRGGWHFKQSWSGAVKLLLEEIIPAYESFYQGNEPTVCVRPVVSGESAKLPKVPKSRKSKAPAA